MATLEKDLKKKVEDQLKAREQPGDRQKAEEQLRDLFAMKANGLLIVSAAGQAFQEFGEVFEAHANDLKAWVTPYGAAAGFWPFWTRIGWTWIESGKNHDKTPVKEIIKRTTMDYAAMVGK